jgi:GT2 family glycosyltransferase
VEILVLDSGSADGSPQIARDLGARVVEMPAADFSHGGARNHIMRLAAGDHVAFLTQDATPAGERWLASLLEGFDLAPDVALTFGPYLPRPDADQSTRRELRDFFAGFSPDGRPVVQRHVSGVNGEYVRRPGPLTFFTDANGCVARWAWEKVPYREVAYAEDQLLGCEMLEAGYAKVFHPGAGVIHSHRYSSLQYLRRCFDEWRGLREVYGYMSPVAPRQVIGRVRHEVAADRAFMKEQGASGQVLAAGTAASVRHHVVRALGSIAGSRSDRLPAQLREKLSLEGRP